MQGHNKEVVKDITTATQLQSELQLSQAQHGVVVLDVYNGEWGHCRALGETFRRLFTDAGDVIYLRFFSVECTAVLESLLHPAPVSKNNIRPRSAVEYCSDTLASFWSSLLEGRRDHSKPYFLFFKEGRMRCHLEGIDTPRICKVVHDLCKPQSPASEFITNASLLQFWERHFPLSESQINASELMRAIRAERGVGAPDLTHEDVAAISAAASETAGIITAEGLQAWVGESGNVLDCVAALLPDKAAAQLIPPEITSTELVAPEAVPEEQQQEEDYADKNGQEATANSADEGEHSPHQETAPMEEIQSPSVHAGDEVEGTAVAEEGQTLQEAAGEEAQELARTEEAEASVSQDDADGESRKPVPMDETQEAAAEEAQEPQEAAAEEAQEPQEAAAEEAQEPQGAAAEETQEPQEAAAEEEAVAASDGAAAPAAKETAVAEEVSSVNQIYINRWVTVSDEEMRAWNIVAGLPLHYPHSTCASLAPFDETTAPVPPTAGDDFPTLYAFLRERGLSDTDISIMCLAADQKVGSESLSYGKLSLILLSCNQESIKQLLPENANFIRALADGTLLEAYPALAYTALCLCASEAYSDECFYLVPTSADMENIDAFAAEDAIVLSALTPLKTNSPTGGGYVARIIGLPKVIELATTDESEDTMVLSQWHARLAVVEKTDAGITFQFVENVNEEMFQAFSANYTARLVDTENRLDKKNSDDQLHLDEL